MHFKLIITLVEDDKTEEVMRAAKEEGATGSTIINQARGEGLGKQKTFFGLSLQTQRDVLLFLVEEHLSRRILERIGEVAEFEENPGTGIAFQVDVEDAVGVTRQVRQLTNLVEDEI
ncbi:nitrogen regulatory protein P-II family [Thiohalospira halophila DSM 15071]|jgi:nitrogen regulatory protein PII|uniref:Nitrogen regulatory protein P-II family n=1 Tax=Thiohalospira halophila DSM 15071 TaxID=1123397 RepID=A0A1I1QBA8_9GAMM|nr:P-II family nitrogen regulator [Thiohalospira halophila]SFD15420.1 nitrogen regulatory protein P-II family [Thiohalospira halophila DSM 15071]